MSLQLTITAFLDSAYFDANLEDEFVAAVHSYEKTILSLNGHKHNFESNYPYEGDIHYLNSDALDKGRYLKIKIWEGDEFDKSHSYEIVEFEN